MTLPLLLPLPASSPNLEEEELRILSQHPGSRNGCGGREKLNSVVVVALAPLSLSLSVDLDLESCSVDEDEDGDMKCRVGVYFSVE